MGLWVQNNLLHQQSYQHFFPKHYQYIITILEFQNWRNRKSQSQNKFTKSNGRFDCCNTKSNKDGIFGQSTHDLQPPLPQLTLQVLVQYSNNIWILIFISYATKKHIKKEEEKAWPRSTSNLRLSAVCSWPWAHVAFWFVSCLFASLSLKCYSFDPLTYMNLRFKHQLKVAMLFTMPAYCIEYIL